MSDTILSVLNILQPLFCPASVLWLVLSKHIPHKTEDEHFFQLTHSILPGILLHYLGVALEIFLASMNLTIFLRRIIFCSVLIRSCSLMSSEALA